MVSLTPNTCAGGAKSKHPRVLSMFLRLTGAGSSQSHGFLSLLLLEDYINTSSLFARRININFNSCAAHRIESPSVLVCLRPSSAHLNRVCLASFSTQNIPNVHAQRAQAYACQALSTQHIPTIHAQRTQISKP